MGTLVLIGLVALITWATINKRYGVLQWTAACFSPAVILFIGFIAGFWFRGEQSLVGIMLIGQAFIGGLIALVVGLAINGLSKK